MGNNEYVFENVLTGEAIKVKANTFPLLGQTVRFTGINAFTFNRKMVMIERYFKNGLLHFRFVDKKQQSTPGFPITVHSWSF